jgi:hypothetical protein
MRPNWDHSYGFLSDGHLICTKGGSSQGVASLTEAARLTDHHDERLAELTRQVNRLFEQHRRHGDGRELAILDTPDGLFLAWTRNEHDKTLAELGHDEREVVTADSDDDEIRQHLGLR